MRGDAYDIAIIGAGIAGASLASWLAPHTRGVLLEAEDKPGYHTTGRSAAMYIESYGPPQVRALTLASADFLRQPPPGFSDHPILKPRAQLIIARRETPQQLDAAAQVLADLSIPGRRLSASDCVDMVPVLRADRLAGGVLELSSADIDVDALLQGYLRTFRRAGGEIRCGAKVISLAREGPHWRIHTSAGDLLAATIVNAAGAWGDHVAKLAGVRPIGLQPKRRTVFSFAPPPGVDARAWPVVFDADESWYIKPEAGLLLGTPANTDPVDAHDVHPEDLDIAIGIDRIQEMTTLAIRRPRNAWAGLRTFSPDGGIVAGFDPDAPRFFWCVGQGGYGIQTSAAMGEACAALVLGRPIPDHIARYGVTQAALSVARIRGS